MSCVIAGRDFEHFMGEGYVKRAKRKMPVIDTLNIYDPVLSAWIAINLRSRRDSLEQPQVFLVHGSAVSVNYDPLIIQSAL